jgi:hypothetical protein
VAKHPFLSHSFLRTFLTSRVTVSLSWSRRSRRPSKFISYVFLLINVAGSFKANKREVMGLWHVYGNSVNMFARQSYSLALRTKLLKCTRYQLSVYLHTKISDLNILISPSTSQLVKIANFLENKYKTTVEKEISIRSSNFPLNLQQKCSCSYDRILFVFVMVP